MDAPHSYVAVLVSIAIAAAAVNAATSCSSSAHVETRPLWRRVEDAQIVERSAVVEPSESAEVVRSSCDPGSGDVDEVIYDLRLRSGLDLETARSRLRTAAVEAGWSEGERSALQADAVLEFDGDTATMRVGAGMEPGTVLVRFDHHASDC